MLTRRDALLAGAGGWLAAQARAGTGPSAAPAPAVAGAEPLGALPGKKPLIQHAFRPPNFETPLAELAAPFTPTDVFFVRYHLAVIPPVDPAAWRLQVGGASAQRPFAVVATALKDSE